ncbi:hypothetical protein QSJ18_19570, partial [Gordonia sp. ABSL1-1]|uniref:hypothetical protein n=1 Tax=Gordonia sp. ABSL1-1 TaxID=3053923 RepID=UPI002574070E
MDFESHTNQASRSAAYRAASCDFCSLGFTGGAGGLTCTTSSCIEHVFEYDGDMDLTELHHTLTEKPPDYTR